MKPKFSQVMKAVAAITCAATICFTTLYHIFHSDWLFSATISFGTTFYHFGMRLLVGALVPPLKSTSAWFRPRKWETAIYRFLRVKEWKQHLPTYDPSQFSLTENTFEQVIRNMCSAEIVHEIIIICSFLPLLVIPVFGAWPVFLITSVLAALFDSLFVMAQRYNRPRLERIYKKQEARSL